MQEASGLERGRAQQVAREPGDARRLAPGRVGIGAGEDASRDQLAEVPRRLRHERELRHHVVIDEVGVLKDLRRLHIGEVEEVRQGYSARRSSLNKSLQLKFKNMLTRSVFFKVLAYPDLSNS